MPSRSQDHTAPFMRLFVVPLFVAPAIAIALFAFAFLIACIPALFSPVPEDLRSLEDHVASIPASEGR
jgi:hypothetical protein